MSTVRKIAFAFLIETVVSISMLSASANAVTTARRLRNAVLLTRDGYGHISFVDPSRCVVRAMGEYLVNLTTPPASTVCPSDRLPFDPNFGEPLPEPTP